MALCSKSGWNMRTVTPCIPHSNSGLAHGMMCHSCSCTFRIGLHAFCRIYCLTYRRPNLGLLHLFGWIEVQAGSPQEGKGWQITNLSFTPLGTAMVVAIVNTLERYEKHLQKIAKNNDQSGLVSLTKFTLQSYLTQWEKRYIPASIPSQEGAYTFKVTLQEAMRRIRINSGETIERLVNTILQSVKFDNDRGWI